MRVFIAGADGWAGSEILSQVIERFGENVVVIGTSESKDKNSVFDVCYEEDMRYLMMWSRMMS